MGLDETPNRQLESQRINDAKIETLLSSLHDTQQQYVYYVLAITAACIGFTISETSKSLIDSKLLAAGIAILLWLLSFLFGILQLSSIEKHIKYNMAELILFKHNAANNKLTGIMGKINFWKNYYRVLQNISLLIGATAFLIWHTQRIVTNTDLSKTKNPAKVEKVIRQGGNNRVQ